MRYFAGKEREMRTHTMTEDMPYWLMFDLVFAEGEDDGDDGEGGGDDDDDDDDEDDDEDKDKPKGKKYSEEEVAGLRSTMVAERAERKKLLKEAKELRAFKAQAEKGDQTAVEKAAEAAKAQEASEARTTKLAGKLLTNSINTEIIKAAGPLKFRDVDDALSLVKRGDIVFEQDEDDPSDVEIDSETVIKALKALAKKKPHLIKSETDEDDEDDDDTPPAGSTGSPVGSRGKRGKKGKYSDEELDKLYPNFKARV